MFFKEFYQFKNLLMKMLCVFGQTLNILLASDVDIAAMKLSAISNRSSKKDFIDLFCILKTYSLKEILGFYTQKYPAGTEFIVLKCLVCFEDAESEPMPFVFDVPDWEEVKRIIQETVAKY